MQSDKGDDFEKNVTLTNSGEGALSFARSASTTNIKGDLTVISSSNSGTSDVYICNNDNSVLNISGSVHLELNGVGGTRESIYFSNRGEINVAQDFVVIAHSSATNAEIFIGNYGNVNITGNLDIDNGGAGAANSQVALAKETQSVVTVDGETSITHNSTEANTINTILPRSGEALFKKSVTFTGDKSDGNSYLSFSRAEEGKATITENLIVNQVGSTTGEIAYTLYVVVN